MIVVIIGFLIIARLVSNPSIIGNVVAKLKSTPNPKLISAQCIGYWKSLNYRVEVKVTVKNEGGDGNVKVTGRLDQDGPEFDNSGSKDIFMKANEIQSVSFYFDGSSFREERCYGEAIAIS